MNRDPYGIGPRMRALQRELAARRLAPPRAWAYALSAILFAALAISVWWFAA